jgi:ribosome maturation factor RimP
MISEASLQKIETLANDVATREGVKIYDIEFSGGPQGQVLRIYIDKEGGVGIDECANVSRGLNELLDENDPLPDSKYNLEVSSPGLERPLKKAWHFEQAVGKKVWLKIQKALENFGSTDPKLKVAKQVTDLLLAVENDGVKIQVGEEQVSIPFSAIEKARMVYDFNEGKHDKKGHPKKGSHHK